MLSVVTANVNGVRAAQRRGGLAWLASSGADVVCLQEVRASAEQLAGALTAAGMDDYSVASAELSSRAGHAGVAVLSRYPVLAVRLPAAIGFDAFADQGRWVEADVATPGGVVTVVSAYVHTGEAGTPKQAEKFAFLDAMTARIDALRAAAAVIAGDLNVAHRREDLKNWKGNLGKAGFLEAEQAYFDRWFSTGWTDLGRAFGGTGPGPYTWWSWRGKAFDNDAGWRIDYLLASPGLASRCVKVEVGRAATYAERWSDHAPVTAWFG